MKPEIIALSLATVAFVSLSAAPLDAPEENLLQFRESGFSIAPLEGKSQLPAYQVLMMFLPPSDGFAPNVNVQIQQFAGDMDAYLSLSKNQFKQLSFELISEEKDGNTCTLEYTGDVGQGPMHWYAKINMGEGRVFLATGTAKESQWEKTSEKLKACVKSMQPSKKKE